jgi:hypothetical protein
MTSTAMQIQALADLMILLDVDVTDSKRIAWITLMITRTESEISMYCNNDFMVDTYTVDNNNSDNYTQVSQNGTTIIENGGAYDYNIDDGSDDIDNEMISSVYTFPPELVTVLEDLIILADVRRGAEGKNTEIVGEYRSMYEADIPPTLRRKLNKRKFMKVF